MQHQRGFGEMFTIQIGFAETPVTAGRNLPFLFLALPIRAGLSSYLQFKFIFSQFGCVSANGAVKQIFCFVRSHRKKKQSDVVFCFFEDPVSIIVAMKTMFYFSGNKFFAFWMPCSCNYKHFTKLTKLKLRLGDKKSIPKFNSLVTSLINHFSVKLLVCWLTVCIPRRYAYFF